MFLTLRHSLFLGTQSNTHRSPPAICTSHSLGRSDRTAVTRIPKITQHKQRELRILREIGGVFLVTHSPAFGTHLPEHAILAPARPLTIILRATPSSCDASRRMR